MTIRKDLHQLVDELDDDDASDLLEYARWLVANQDERFGRHSTARDLGGAEQPALH
jgi:hypothetical protein